MLYNKRIVVEISTTNRLIMTIDENMLSCEFGALDRGNITDVIDWGIYANRGSVSFIDNIGYFINKNINSAETANYTARFYLCKNEKQLIATFDVEGINFNEETREVNIELVSKLYKLQSEKMLRSVYPFYETSLEDIIVLLNDSFPSSKIYLGSDITNLSYKVGCPYIGKDTVWNAMTKICQASMSRITDRADGTPEITSSFPSRNPIIINPNNIINVQDAGFVRINTPHIELTKREKFFNKVLDGSRQNFSIDWDSDLTAPKILDAQGINISKVETIVGEEGNVFVGDKSIYVEGTVKVKTPHKIFAVYDDTSTFKRKFVLQEESEEYPSVNRETDISYSLCSSPSIEDEQNIVADLKRMEAYLGWESAAVAGSSTSYAYAQLFIPNGTISFPITTFEDKGKITHYYKKSYSSEDRIESNDLIQDSTTTESDIGSHIVEDVYRRYHNGIECFEIECLFNDYYFEDGSVAVQGNDISQHFSRYDVVVPYVVKRGKTVPLRTNQDGTPKKFRIIGISYSYDGLLRQKLSVQEERYDVD